MNLFTAVIYYIGVFIFSAGCIVAGWFVGLKLRKRKDAKITAEAKKETVE